MPQTSVEADADMVEEEEEVLQSWDMEVAHAFEEAMLNGNYTFKPHRLFEFLRTCIPISYLRNRHQEFKDEWG